MCRRALLFLCGEFIRQATNSLASCFDPLRPNRLERIRGHYGIVLFGSELEVRFDDA